MRVLFDHQIAVSKGMHNFFVLQCFFKSEMLLTLLIIVFAVAKYVHIAK